MLVESAIVPSDIHTVVALDDTDQKVLALWLAQRPRTTTRSYLRAWRYLQIATGGVELHAIQLPHLQAYAQSLRGMKVSSQVTFIAAIQSLCGFACKIGYLPVNLGTLLRRPPLPVNIAERIVDEADIQRMLALTIKPRDATLLRLAYVAGLRIAELSGLRWRCFAPRENGAVLSVVGKGGRLRHIFLPDHIAAAVAALRHGAADSAPVFLSRNRNALSVNAMHSIVKQAAQRAGLPPTFSMHWCRHAHASHAMDRGAPVHVVQQTLGHASLATTCRYVHCKPAASSAQFIAAC
jgi:site-specific recombinase XerD